jgi:hypothetical protein
MFAKCQNCGRRVFGRPSPNEPGIFCSTRCRNNFMDPGFCGACVAATTPTPAGSSIRINGIGAGFYFGRDWCKTCGSVVQSQWFCVLFIPLVPMGKFRVKYVTPNRFLSRTVPSDREWQHIAKNLEKAGWTWGCTERVDSNGKTIFVADAHRSDGKHFAVRADHKFTAFSQTSRSTIPILIAAIKCSR